MGVNKQGIGMTSQRARDRMALTLKDMGVDSCLVLEVMKTVPRHLFVDEALASRAYENTALPIGYNQTISQPYIVAKMVEAVLHGNDNLGRVLEIGTGCGYQSVILAQVATQVYTLERIRQLLFKAREMFHLLKCNNISTHHGDGTHGWPKHEPYDAIVVSAAPSSIPNALLEQLAINGRLVIPVGTSEVQQLLLITRHEDGMQEQTLDMVSFVPMVRGLH